MKNIFCRRSRLKTAVAVCLLVSGTAIAQMRTITGIVTQDKKPISGVSVSQEGSSEVAITNSSGKYQIQVSGENPVLIFRHPDFAEQSRNVNGNVIVNISLDEKVSQIEEIVLNAGYYKVKEKESTGSIARVTAKDIENQPVTNVLSAVQGRMAGVNIIQNSGTPGGSFEVQIRGVNSLRREGNTPLYIIDGMQIPSVNNFNSALSIGIIPYGEVSPLSGINPDDIESIEVLKDADATAIYGSKGANGVILITTKKGKRGKTLLNLTSSYGYGRASNLPRMMSTQEYIKVREEALANDGITTIPATQYDINGIWDREKYTDWQKYFIGNTSEYSNIQLSASGGSKNTTFSINAGHNEETTIFPGNYRYKRNSLNAAVHHQSDDEKFKLSFTNNFSTQSNILPPRDFNQVYTTLAPNAPSLFNPDGTYNWENGTFTNPLGAASQTYDTAVQSLINNVNVSYLLIKGLTLDLNAGFGYNDTGERKIFPKTMYNPSYNIGSERSSLQQVSKKNTNWLIEPQIIYNKNWGIHDISFLFGASYQEQKSDNQTISGSNFPSDDLLYNLSSAATLKIIGSGKSTYRYQAIYSRLNYSLHKKYIINVTGRRDGSSRFGDNRRFGNFGAIGIAWLISDEKFLENSKWLSFAKLRGSYGITGNDQIGDYQFYDTYYLSGGDYDGYSGLLPARLYNKDFGWESTKKFEAALEMSLFRDRIFFSTAYYRNVSGNQLVGIPLPATTGFTSVQANMDATVLNRGWEIVLQSDILKSRSLKWSLSLNITLPVNKLLSFPQLEGSSYQNLYSVGKSTSLKKLYHFTGIDAITGLYTFADMNNDGVINSLDKTIEKELTRQWYGGFQSNITYKNWGLNILFQFSRGNVVNMFGSASRLGGAGNKAAVYLDYWSPENPNATFQKPSAGYDSAASTANTMFTQSDATISNTFVAQLENISLTYNLPLKYQSKINTKIFLQGQNLFSFTNYKGVSSEFSLTGFISPLQVISTGITLTY